MTGALTRQQTRAGIAFASPWLVGFCVFLAYPVLASIYFSFCDYSVLKAPVYIGGENYKELWGDEVFWTAIKNTLFYAVMALPTGMLTALILAMLLNAKVKGMAIFRTIFFIPALVPQVSLAVLWLWILNGEHGILNNLLNPILHVVSGIGNIGVGALNAMGHPLVSHTIDKLDLSGPNWLGSPTWSKPSMVVLGVWGVGNAMLIYLASLQDVPTELVEAADLDGASSWQKTLNVTIPMISPVILFNMIMGIIGTLQVFTVPYIMFPNGDPARATYFYTEYLFDNAFKYHRMGYACAMGWILFVMIMVLTFVSIRFSERHVHYQGG